MSIWCVASESCAGGWKEKTEVQPIDLPLYPPSALAFACYNCWPEQILFAVGPGLILSSLAQLYCYHNAPYINRVLGFHSNSFFPPLSLPLPRIDIDKASNFLCLDCQSCELVVGMLLPW